MIHYSLRCAKDHAFDAWFHSSATFDTQAAAGHIECPQCGDQRIEKAPMAPGLISGRSDGAEPRTETQPPVAGGDPQSPRKGKAQRSQDIARQVLEAFEALRNEVVANADNVGRQFPEEARKIHYGETDARVIYGEATEKEALELADEGVEFQRLPLPVRKNS